MERAHRHKGYDITLTSMKEVGGWVPAAIIKSAPMQTHRDEWTIRDTSRPQPTQDAADRIALDQAMSSIDKQATRSQAPGQQAPRPQAPGPQGPRPQQAPRPDENRSKNDFRKQNKAS